MYLWTLEKRLYVRNEPPGYVKWLAELVRDDVIAAIETQRFAAKYDPLSPAYVKRKISKSQYIDFWRATGYLMENIQVYWSGSKGGYVVDFRYMRYPETGVLLRNVARWVEYGSSHMPPRPLFRPVLEQVRRRIQLLRRFFRGY